MKLNLIIKSLREDKGLTQEKLAQDSGLTRGYISRMEKGTYTVDSPSIKTLRKIAKGLSVPLEFILSRAGITQEDYIKVSTPIFLRAKYNLDEEQIRSVETYIQLLKKQLKA